jgi:hypothetical protein
MTRLPLRKPKKYGVAVAALELGDGASLDAVA